MDPVVTKQGALYMQVCVPEDWTDDQAKAFADRENPSGLDAGWHIRKQGHRLLAGAPERARCKGRRGFVHIMLDA